MNPFSLITEPTAVKRILFTEGLLDIGSDITGDGFAFVPIDSPGHWGLVIAHKDKQGNVTFRVATADKRAGQKLMAETFAAIMEDASHRIGTGIHFKVMPTNQN